MANEPRSSQQVGEATANSLDVYWRMLLCLTCATGVIAVLIVLLVALDFWRPPVVHVGPNRFVRCETLFAVAFVGALGAAFSSLLRVSRLKDLPDNVAGDASLSERDLRLYALTPLLIGVISALVLTDIFSAGLLRGDMFPELPNLHFENPQAGAKALFWSFVAGFAERLVPGFLEGFAKSASSKAPDDGTQPEAPPAPSSRAEAHEN